MRFLLPLLLALGSCQATGKPPIAASAVPELVPDVTPYLAPRTPIEEEIILPDMLKGDQA